MRQGIRVLIGAVLGLALTVGLLVGLGTPAMAETTTYGSIYGVVTDSTGVPVVGATVTLFTIAEDNTRTEVKVRTTRSNGHFWIRHVPVGTYALRAFDPNLDRAATWLNTPSTYYVPVTFEVGATPVQADIKMHPGLSISGTTKFQGEPQAGVTVCLSTADVPCAVSDANGAYTLRGIPERFYTLRATPPSADLDYVTTYFPSYTTGFSELSEVLGINAESSKVAQDFTLAARPFIAGTVVTVNGAPIAGASVCLSSCVKSSEDGAFRMNVDIPYKYFPTLTASAAGYQDQATKIWAGSQDIRFVLEAATPSEPTTPVKPTAVSAAKPSITGKTKVGARLTAKAGAWGPTGVKLSYQWYRNGHKVSGATKTTYRLTWRDWRKKVTVKVTGKLDGYVTVTKGSKATRKIAWR